MVMASEGKEAEPWSHRIQEAHRLCDLILTEATLVQAFKGRWMVITSRIRQISESLQSLQTISSHSSSSPSPSPSPSSPSSSSELLLLRHSYIAHLDGAILPSIMACLEDCRGLARKSIDLSYGGKLLMQSNLDTAAARLELCVRDLELVASGVRQDARARSISRRHMARDGASSGPGPAMSASLDPRMPRGFSPDLDARMLRGGDNEVKKAALQALIDQLGKEDPEKKDPEKSGRTRAELVAPLVRLLNSSSQAIREKATHAVSLLLLLPSAKKAGGHDDECKERLAREGAHRPLVRILASGSPDAREAAAAALFELTLSAPESAHSVASHGGIPPLVTLCRSGTPPAAATASSAGTLRNLAAHEHLRRPLTEHGAVEALVRLVLSGSSGTSLAQEYAVEALQSLASGRDARLKMSIVRKGGAACLVKLLLENRRSSCPSSIKSRGSAIRALSNLASTSAAVAREIVSDGYMAELAHLLESGPPDLRLASASAIGSLSSYVDLRKELCETGCIASLNNMLESEHKPHREAASQALSTLLLANRNRKEFGSDEKGISRLLHLLDPRRSILVAKRLPMSALLAFSGGSNAYTKRIKSGPILPPTVVGLEKLASVAKKNALDKFGGGKKLFRIFTRSSS